MKVSGTRMISVLAPWSLPWVLIVCFMFPLSSSQTSSPEGHYGNSQPAPDISDTRRCFFGTSDDAKLGNLAWLFCIDKEGNGGQIFVAPRMIDFSDFNLLADGTLTFHSINFFDKYYQFAGTLKSGEITGEIQLIDAKSANSKGKWQLTATQISPQNPLSSQSISPARYSNVDYSAEGGDFTGVDIRFFSVGTRTTGMIVFYESYWGEPTFTVLALSRIETSKGTIQFEMKIPDGVAHYRLLLTTTGALFKRDEVAHENGAKGIVLKKSRSVLTTATGRGM